MLLGLCKNIVAARRLATHVSASWKEVPKFSKN